MSKLLRRSGAILLLVASASFLVRLAYRDRSLDSRMLRENPRILADSLRDIGELEPALREYRKSLDAYRHSGDRVGEALALYEIGAALYDLERYNEALVSWREALLAFEQLDDQPRIAQTLKCIGWIYDDLSEYQTAIQYYQRSMEIAQAIGDKLLEAQNLNNIGVACRNLSQFPEAARYFEQSLQIRRKLGDRRGEANTLNNIGMVYDDQSFHFKALEYYHRSLKIFTEIEDRDGASRVLGNLGVAYKSLSDYTRALEYHRRSLELKRDLGDQKGVAVTLHNIGVVYDLLYDAEKALSYYEASLQISRDLEDRIGEAATLDNIGGILAVQGHYDDALLRHQQSLIIRQEAGDRKGEGISLSNLGYISFKMGDLVTAQNYYQRDLDICRELNDRSGECLTLADLGTVFAAQRKFDKADAYLQLALNIAVADGVPSNLLLVWAALGNFHQLQERWESSVADYGRAVDILENVRSRLQVEAQKTSFASGGADLYEAIIAALVQLGDIETAFHYVERSKARSFLDLLAVGGEVISNQSALIRKSADNNEKSSADRVKSEEPEMTSPVSVEALTVKEIQKQLTPDVALLEYYITRENTLIWRLTQSDVRFYQTPVGGDSLQRLVTGLRDEIQYLGDSRYLPEALYNILLSTCADLPESDRLIIVPHGILHYLPFAALRVPEGYYVAERWGLSVLPSASTLKFLRRNDAYPPNSLLAFGNPSIADADYPPLPFAEREVKSIADFFSIRKIFTRKAATESRLMQLAADFDVIHLACHSDLNSAYPLFSKLLLAPDKEQDGELSVYEIFQLPIKADLVVLSACRTGMGKLTNGDEVVGLSRAFLATGASAVLVSLWRVDDAATMELMAKFYGYLHQCPPTEALRRAQVDCLRANVGIRSWAPFVLIGGLNENPRN